MTMPRGWKDVFDRAWQAAAEDPEDLQRLQEVCLAGEIMVAKLGQIELARRMEVIRKDKEEVMPMGE